jgi:hypothetical protein
MGKGVTYWGTGRNDETTTPNIRAEKYDYPSSNDPSDPATVSSAEGAAGDPGYDGSIEIPMNQGNVNSKSQKKPGGSNIQVPSV